MRRAANPPDRRRGWNEVARVLPEPFDIPRDACGGRQLSCGTSTYAGDPTHGAGPGGTRRRSIARGLEKKFEETRNSRAYCRSTRLEFFHCVTTRPPRRLTQTVKSPGFSFAHAADALPGRVSGDLRQSLAVYAAAWPPAIGAVHANSRAPGNSAASGATPGNSARSLCASRCAIPAVRLWPRHRLPLYARYVSREVLLPLGPPGEDRNILLGHLPIRGLVSTEFSGAIRRLVRQLGEILDDRRRNTVRDEGRRTQKPSHRAARNQAQAKETGKETVLIRSGLKGNNQGDGQVKSSG